MVNYLMIINQEESDGLNRLEIGNRVESDHQPLEIKIRGRVGKIEEEQMIEKTIEKWNKESIRKSIRRKDVSYRRFSRRVMEKYEERN